MAKKARFYEVTTKNGYGEQKKIVSAPKKSLIASVFETPDVQVSNIEYLGFKEVIARPNAENNDVSFVVPSLDGLTIDRNQPGHKTLSLQFDDKVKQVYKYLDAYQSGELS
ncbi:hypothetical protein [Rheinheimera sp. F8]|uniref:hypothetical protein n=1 Tax=Rheinheimera sp. F8 TaxID=1763998 RepID=UPI000744C264|nr:hypothetical protein [Rheinheimera sp. F8]ALZ75398.1 hypothetical protein ATY27_06280 [Rheinheimera sp. F8]ALZ75788.1 hypothetical protein ATY27_08425 [Rheinheimera sp. F8]